MDNSNTPACGFSTQIHTWYIPKDSSFAFTSCINLVSTMITECKECEQVQCYHGWWCC